MGQDDWNELLSALDRHEGWRYPSPDLAGLPDLMRVNHIPGISIAVRRADAPLWVAGYGTTTPGGGTPIGVQTAFQACSISKHVTAVGTLRLVERGVLDLDADIETYLTSWRLPDADGWHATITLRQLLSHTAGLSDNWFPGYDRGTPLPTTEQTLVGAAPATRPPVRATMLPGSRFRYSGAHYAVLEQLLVDVTGTGFAELMRELVLEPFGLADSGFDQNFPNAAPAPVALGHYITGAQLGGGHRLYPEMAGAGLWTTPSDLTRLGAEILAALDGRSTLLSRELATEMITPQVPDGYGLGTAVTRARFGHTGGNVGYVCWLFSWPAAGVSMAVMANGDLCDAVVMGIRTVADRLYAPPDPVVDAPESPVGTYRFGHYVVEITATEDGLVLKAKGQRPLPLLPLPGGGYRAAGLDCVLVFRDGGAADLVQQGATVTGNRVDTESQLADV